MNVKNYRKNYKTYKIFSYYGLLYNLYDGKRIDNLHSKQSFFGIFIGYITLYSDGKNKPELIRMIQVDESDRAADILHECKK